MAFYSGTATSFADLQSVVENNCVANGWVLNSGILSKSGCFFKLTSAAKYLRLYGGTSQSTSTLNGMPAQGVMLGSVTGYEMAFPINYDIHIFNDPDEVYLVVSYNNGFYQQLSFGKSNIPGIGGTGAWFTGSYRSNISLTNSTDILLYMGVSADSCGAVPYGGIGVGLFFSSSSGVGSYPSNFVHCGLDSVGWKTDGTTTAGTGFYGASYAAGLLSSLPNLANNANVLVPIKAIQYRNSNGRTIIANLFNARYLRIDNINPGEIITFGSERWKVYPMYRKDTVQRNGLAWSTGAMHSGTWGYAVRYTGV